jgi:hypothetical protein
MLEEPKATTKISEFLESNFLTSRGLGRKPKSPMEKLTTGSDGFKIKQVHIYGDSSFLKILYPELPPEVKVIHHPSLETSFLRTVL